MVERNMDEMETIHVVGNQAGDVDSIVSALVAAHLLNTLKEREGKTNVKYQAVVSFPKADFKLRGDAIELFKMAGWEMEEHKESASYVPVGVTFLDEVEGMKGIVLTDANVIGQHLLQKYGADLNVRAIFDHHRDEGFHLQAKHRVIDQSCGSTCSILANEISSQGLECPQQMVILMYGTILLDTRNFSDGRFSNADLSALDWISKLLPQKLFDSKRAIFDLLMSARNDVSHLSFADLLRLDYKEVEEGNIRIGFSTVFESISKLVAETDLENDMLAMINRNKLAALFAITSVESDSERRGFLLCVPERQLADDVVRGLKSPVDQTFSPQFLSLPLCSSQKIVSRGFGLEEVVRRPIPNVAKHANAFNMWTIHGTITRKTMMPAILELIARSKRI